MDNKITEKSEKPYEFRELCAKDIPLMTSVIKAIGINEFKACFKEDVLKDIVKIFTGEKNANADGENKADAKENRLAAVGVSLLPSVLDVAEIVLNNMERCETALIKLLSRTSNLSVEKVENLSLADFANMVIDFLKKEEFPDFFKVVSTFIKPEK
jgi:hypothetical protein